MIRAFLALDLPAHIRSQLVLTQFLLPVARKVPPENFHLTLVFLGESPMAQLEELDSALDRLAFDPFTIRLQGLGLFGKSKPHNLHAAVAPCPELMRLQEKLVGIARAAGFAPPKRRFTPHVTLSYLGGAAEGGAPLEAAVAQHAGFQSEPFEAREIVLFRSILKREGAEYDALAHYPLSADLRASNR